MYLAGVSVRRVEDVTEALWGTRVSSGTVSRLNQRIYEQIEAWRQRPITGASPYVYLAGVSLKRSWGGEVRNVSVLIAIGVGTDGYRHILGVAEGEKEDLEGWRGFLRHLKTRGLKGAVQLIISDACVGLVEAAAECYPKARWQRCVVHWYRNVFSHTRRGQIDVVARMLKLKVIHAQEDSEGGRTESEGGCREADRAEAAEGCGARPRDVQSDADLLHVPEHPLATDPHQQSARAHHPRSAAAHASRWGLSRWPVRIDAGRGQAPAHRGHEVGHEALSHGRVVANATPRISRVTTQTEACRSESAKDSGHNQAGHLPRRRARRPPHRKSPLSRAWHPPTCGTVGRRTRRRRC